MDGKKRPERRGQRYKAVLFDKDGVLLDSFDTVFGGVNETRSHYGLPPLTKQEFVDKVWGKRASVEKNVFGATSDGELDERYGYYRQKRMELEHKTKIYPATIEVLESLKGKVKMGLITNTFREIVTEVLADFGLDKYFDVVMGGDDTTKAKPAPDPILKACETLGVEPHDAVFVGDTVPDIQGGHAPEFDNLDNLVFNIIAA